MPAEGLRRRVISHPTPRMADVIFYEVKKADNPRIKDKDFNQPHPDRDKFPNHVLVAVRPSGDNDEHELWYYAADREDQDDYNFEISFPYSGIKEAPRFTRTYLVRRKNYKPLKKGTADPRSDNPKEREEDAQFEGAKLIDERLSRLGDSELDSLFVLVVRLYDKVPTIQEQAIYNAEITFPYGEERFPRYTRVFIIPRQDFKKLDTSVEDDAKDLQNEQARIVSQRSERFNDPASDSLYVKDVRIYDVIPDLNDEDDKAALGKFGYRVQRPHGQADTLRLTWTFPIRLSAYSAAANNEACPIDAFNSLKLTDEQLADEADTEDRGLITRVYDALPGPNLTRIEKLRNATIPERFISDRTITRIQNRNAADATIDAPAGSPLDAGGAVLQTGISPEGGVNNISLMKSSVRHDYTIAALSGFELDEDSGLLKPVTHEVVPAGTAGTPVSADGTYATVTPINPHFSIKTTRKTVATLSETWEDIINFTWPAVLTALTGGIAHYPDGTTVKKVYWDYDVKGPYSGPCRASITESWSVNAPAAETVTTLTPTPIEWDFRVWRGRIPPTLHGAITLTETIGNNNPDWNQGTINKTFAATSPTNWPASIIASVRVQKWRGGFKKRKVVVYSP